MSFIVSYARPNVYPEVSSRERLKLKRPGKKMKSQNIIKVTKTEHNLTVEQTVNLLWFTDRMTCGSDDDNLDINFGIGTVLAQNYPYSA